jgi:glycerol-3-phosphate dehydrogenase (NAD(P)+)
MNKKFSTAIVIGGGAFGTSLAYILSDNFEKVIIKVRSEQIYESLKSGENKKYLPGQKLNENIVPALTWDEVDKIKVDEVQIIVSGLPTSAIRPYCKINFNELDHFLKQGTPFVSLAKGIDVESLKLPDELFYEHFYKYRDQFVFLSGPSFAQEILDRQITLVTIAGCSKPTLLTVSEMLECGFFKALPNYDVKGVLLGGALKNVLAIAGGVIEGLGYNYNTRAAMITRGIVEMLRFGNVYNARSETFYGLAGMGDLILTTTGGLSRNKNFGIEIAKGRSASEIIESSKGVVEGYKTTKSVFLLCNKYDIRARIYNGVYEVLYKGYDPKAVIEQIMKTPTKFEFE